MDALIVGMFAAPPALPRAIRAGGVIVRRCQRSRQQSRGDVSSWRPMPSAPSTELDELLRDIGWSPRELARRLGIGEATARSWQTGRRAPHASVVEWLRVVRDKLQEAGSAPPGWDRAGAPC
jgi:DNA-binding transcriptional regulator YiaG